MRDVPMPRDLSEEAVAEWLRSIYEAEGMFTFYTGNPARREQARAVRALLREKVREAVMLTHRKWRDATDPTAWHPMALPLVREVTTELLGEEAPRG